MATSYTYAAADAATVSLLSGASVTGQDVNSLINAGKANLAQSFGASLENTNTASTYGTVFNRNNSLTSIATDLTKTNNNLKNSGDDQTYSRQAEINEWAANNKLDTLFFLQVSFIFFTLLVVLIYLRQAGILSSGTMYITAGVFLLILLGILWNRASYTMYSRDSRYWNRRFIGLSDSGLGATPATCPS